MELEYTRVEAFEIKGIRFTCVSRWNGLEEWQDAEGRKMIVARGHEGGCAATFQQLFGDSIAAGTLRVISAAPDLVALFKA